MKTCISQDAPPGYGRHTGPYRQFMFPTVLVQVKEGHAGFDNSICSPFVDFKDAVHSIQRQND